MFAQLRRDIREMWTELREYNELLVMMTRRDLMLRYRQTVMGFAWAVFMPVINTIVFTLIFTKSGEASRPTFPTRCSPTAGCCPGTLFATSFKSGVYSLFKQPALPDQGLLSTRSVSVFDDARRRRGFGVRP